MKIVERIYRFIEAECISLSEFDQKIEASNGYIGKQIKKGGSIGSHIIEKIIYSYPYLNVRWLMTGEGEMYVSTDITNKKLSKIERAYSNEEDFVIVNMPLESVAIIAKTLEVDGALSPINSKTISLTSLEYSDFVLDQPNYLCVKYTGESMMPSIKSGTYLIISKLGKTGWSITELNLIYIVYSTKGMYLGRIVNELETGSVIISMDNPDKHLYPDVRVNVSEIKSLWCVKGYMLSPEQNKYPQKDFSVPLSNLERKLKRLLKEVKKLNNEILLDKRRV